MGMNIGITAADEPCAKLAVPGPTITPERLWPQAGLAIDYLHVIGHGPICMRYIDPSY